MIRTLLHILSHTAMAALLCAAFTACSSDSGPGATGDDVDSDEVRLVLTLAMNAPATRGDWEGYDPGDAEDARQGEGYENRINPDDVQVLIYSSTGTLLAQAQNIAVFYDGNSDNNTLTVIGSVPVEDHDDLIGKEIKDAKIMVLANCGNPNIGADTDLGGLTFSWDSDKYNTKYIPMWGVTTQTLNLQAGKRTDIGEVWLLRAVAKIEVSLDQRMSAGISITGVSINKVNTRGYCLPAGYNTVGTTPELDFSNTMSIPDGIASSVKSDVPFTAPTSPTEPTSPYCLYLTEYDNKNATSENALSLTVTLHDENATTDKDATKEYTFSFADYNDKGEEVALRDVMRNRWYKFTVYKSGNELRLKVTVENWHPLDEETLPLEPK